jgi:hypothetical protein
VVVFGYFYEWGLLGALVEREWAARPEAAALGWIAQAGWAAGYTG